MSLINYGKDYKYANTRLSGTMVMLPEFGPVAVERVNGDGHLQLSSYLNLECPMAHLEDLDLSPIKLGYVTAKGGVGFVMRKPARHYKQGQNNENCHWMTQIKCNVFSRNVFSTAANIFPSLENACQLLVNEEVDIQPVSKDFAISWSSGAGELHFRTMKVGDVVINYDNAKPIFKLGGKFAYLSEMLEEQVYEK